MINSSMNRIAVMILALAVFATGVCLGFSGKTPRERYEEKFDKTVSLASDGRVQIRNLSGLIKVESWARNEVKISAVKISRAGSQDRAKSNAALVIINVRESGNTIDIETQYPQTHNRFGRDDSINISVDYQLFIPEKASIKVNSTSGDVDIEKIGGFADIHVTSGDLTVSQAGNGLQVKVISGTIRIDDVKGDITLRAVSGSVIVDRVRGSLDVDNTSGRVELRGVSEADTVQAKSLSGGISYEGKINPRGRYSFDVHSGTIEVVLPSDSAFELDAETFSGGIETDFAVQVLGKVSRNELHGTVNGGGASLDLKTFSGNIRIRKSK